MTQSKWLIIAGAVLIAAGFTSSTKAETPPDSLQGRLDTLEQKQKILERKYEIDQEAAAAKAKEAPSVTANAKDGFTVRSADGNFIFKLTGYIQADGRFYLSDQAGAQANTFLLRRVRPSFEGTANKYIDFRILPDFGGGTTALQDAYVDLRYTPKFRVRVGKFKEPFGLERLQSGTSLTFIERALPANLGPNRDVGAQLHGDLWGGAVSYAAGVFNGVVDAGSSDGDTADNKDLAGRLFFLPFKNTDASAWKEFGFGAAWSRGKQRGATAATGLASYRTQSQQTFYAYRSLAVADGQRTRFSPQFHWHPGRVGFLVESVASSQEVKSTSTLARDTLTNTAWQVAASFVLTGESTSFKGVKPRKPFDPANHSWGAWELAARYSEQINDDDAFPLYANAASSARSAHAWTGGLNWYLNTNVKVQSNYEYTTFTRGAAVGDKDPERAILTRVQVAF